MLNSIDDKLLQKLQCPGCKKRRFFVREDSLKCMACGSSYKVINNAVVFAEEFNQSGYEKEKIFWEKNIQNFYEDESEESYQNYIRCFPINPDNEVIEVGCGSGAMLKYIPAKFKVGFDLMFHLLQFGEDFYAIQGLAENLPFKNNSFDLVYYKGSMHHMLDKEKALKEAARIAKDNGYVILCEPNLSHPHRRLSNNPKSFLRRANILSRVIGPIETFMTEKMVIKLAAELKLEHIKTVYLESLYSKFSFRQSLQKIYRSVFGVFLPDRFVYPNYIVVFKK